MLSFVNLFIYYTFRFCVTGYIYSGEIKIWIDLLLTKTANFLFYLRYTNNCLADFRSPYLVYEC